MNVILYMPVTSKSFENLDISVFINIDVFYFLVGLEGNPQSIRMKWKITAAVNMPYPHRQKTPVSSTQPKITPLFRKSGGESAIPFPNLAKGI